MAPLYDYVCEKGHVTEQFRHMSDPEPGVVRCGSCPHLASRVFAPPAVIDDFPEHVSIAFGCVVKNRAHHRELQRIHGTHDWQPVKEAPLFSKLRKEGYAI